LNGLTSSFELALLGADDPLGEAVLALLDEREIPIGRLHALTLHEADASVSLGGQDWPCLPMADFDYTLPGALLVTSRASGAVRQAAALRASRPTMPQLDTTSLDPAPAVAVARVVRALQSLGQVTGADAFVSLPVAYTGKHGVEELIQQTRGLFNMESPEPEAFPLQIAFNLVPGFTAQGSTSFETVLEDVCKSLTGGCDTAFSVVTAPMFFGSAVALHLRTEAAPQTSEVRAALRKYAGITLMEAELRAGDPTPATDAQGSQEVFVGRVRVTGSLIQCWLVFDPLALEAAQMVNLLENWIDKPASSMLT